MPPVTERSNGLVIQSAAPMTGPKSEARLLREADCYVLASHFFWGLWAVVNAPVSSIPFGYAVRFLKMLHNFFFKQKLKLIDFICFCRNMLKLDSALILSTKTTY